MELTIFVAGELSDEESGEVIKRARELLGEGVVVNFKIDPGLLGGAALASKGRYKDYSLQARLEENKSEISKIYYEKC